MNNRRLQMLYQKTEFNNHKINQLSTIFRCCKCKKNNSVYSNNSFQYCIFCGMPNYTAKYR